MYSGKNKGSLATTPSGKISYSQTSETLSGTASTISLLQENNNVNKKITQSKQFVRWFGDWQNSPKSASKVVDGNGEPLVVYHQTGNDFTVFDTKHTGAGEFDSEMPTGIFMKPTSDNIGLRGNKQMALYANIRNPLTVNNRAELVRFYEKNIDGYKEAREDIRYAIDDTKQEEVDFRKALTREEWASFYSSLNKYNQRDNLKISKNGILIPDEHNTQDYKLVYYNGNYQSPKVLAVYKLKNFDYTIHDNQMDFEKLLNELRRSDENDKYAKAILANNTKVFGTVFERYGGHGWVTIDNTRESVSDRRNIKETADGAGTYENSEREVSGGLSEDKISDIRYAIDDTKSSAEKYSEDDFENKVVYPNMDERQRAQILRNERIKLSSYDSKNALSPDDVASLENSVKRNAFKILRELGTEFNVYKNYTNENIELDFDYSKSGLKESIDKQGNITTNYTDFAKMLTVFDDVIRNAVPIEVHTDKYVGTKRENPDLKYDYVLLSAFTDDNYIVPVELHIKEYKESYRINNKLYVSITLGKIKIEDNIITGSLLKNNNEVANSVPLSSEVSIPELVSEVNEKLGNFYKYLPDELLSETQLKYKKMAAEKDRQRLSTMRNKTIQTENKSDIRYAIDDTLNDWLDDLPEGIDYEKVVEKNPVVAVAKIYNSASKTAESGLRQSQNVRLEEKDYLRIADKIMDKYGIKGKYNPNYKQELAEQLTGFIEHIGEKGSNFTDVFEELVNDCKGGI